MGKKLDGPAPSFIILIFAYFLYYFVPFEEGVVIFGLYYWPNMDKKRSNNLSRSWNNLNWLVLPSSVIVFTDVKPLSHIVASSGVAEELFMLYEIWRKFMYEYSS